MHPPLEEKRAPLYVHRLPSPLPPHDQVTVSLRVVAVQTGEILLTVHATKTIASHKTGSDVFRFLDLGTKALELETGAATNEPVSYAIRSTIEHAVLQMVYEGVNKNLWKIKGIEGVR